MDLIFEAGGWGTAVSAVILQAANSFNIADINPYLTGVTAILGIVFIIYKIRNVQLKNRTLKKDLEDNEKEI